MHGRLITESLRVGADLALPGLRLTRIAREDVSASRGPGQPDVFTIVDFEGPDAAADDLAALLAGALAEGPGWYADFQVGADHVVVFPGRVFRYATGDEPGRAAAVEYGASVGVPRHQLDWEG